MCKVRCLPSSYFQMQTRILCSFGLHSGSECLKSLSKALERCFGRCVRCSEDGGKGACILVFPFVPSAKNIFKVYIIKRVFPYTPIATLNRMVPLFPKPLSLISIEYIQILCPLEILFNSRDTFSMWFEATWGQWHWTEHNLLKVLLCGIQKNSVHVFLARWIFLNEWVSQWVNEWMNKLKYKTEWSNELYSGCH